METSEYKNIYKNESTHFFYSGNHNTVITLIKRYIDKNPIKILDAGCGTGLLTKKLSAFGKVVGIDFSPLAVNLSKKRGVNAIIGSVTKLPFKNSSFDVVVCIDVLYHIRVVDDQKALDEFFRVLKPGGLLILKLPALDWLRGKHDIVVQTKHRYATNEIYNKLAASKFRIEKLSYFSFFLLPPALFKRCLNIFKRSKKTESDITSVPRLINSMFVWLYKTEVFVLKFINLPIGLSVLAVAKKP